MEISEAVREQIVNLHLKGHGPTAISKLILSPRLTQQAVSYTLKRWRAGPYTGGARGGHAPPRNLRSGFHIRGDPYDFGGILRFGDLGPPRRRKLGLGPPPSLNPVYGPAGGRLGLWITVLVRELRVLLGRQLIGRESARESTETPSDRSEEWPESSICPACPSVASCTGTWDFRASNYTQLRLQTSL